MISLPILVALIGFAGVVVGALVAEYLRRGSRIERYSDRIFDKRIEIYEGLLSQLRESAAATRDLFDESTLSNEDKESIAFEVGLTLLAYCDKHVLFLNDEIIVHCGATFVGVPDVLKMSGQDRIKGVANFERSVREAHQMIIAESGMERMNALFRSITNAKHQSTIVDYFRAARKKMLKEDRAGGA